MVLVREYFGINFVIVNEKVNWGGDRFDEIWNFVV